MRELRTSGSVGRAPGNRCLYPEGDGLQLPLRFSFQPRLTRGVSQTTREDNKLAPEIKILHANDKAVLDNVASGVFDSALDSQLVAEFLRDPRHHLVVAIDQGQVIAFASGVHYIHPDKSPELWINEVGVAPSHQGRGIGKAVIAALLDHAERLGCGEAWVLTERSNHAAMRLYASAGGQEARQDQVMFTFFINANNASSREAG